MGTENEPTAAASGLVVTRLLNEAAEGNPSAAAELLPLVYEQLRSLAARKMRGEREAHTMQATALVHEAYLRLVGRDGRDGGVRWDGRWHFFAAAAEAMRRILVENARRRGTAKRGGDRPKIALDNVELTVAEPPEQLLALDEALEQLAARHPEKARLVKLRYFAGLTMEQAAEAMGISVRTAGRDWAYARAWLFAHVAGDDEHLQ
jgi:RNA polymerase sigma factor (TIGR02999 family)